MRNPLGWRRRAEAPAPAEQPLPVALPALPCPPLDRISRAEGELAEIVQSIREGLDEGTAAALDPLVDAWGAEWEAADRGAVENYQRELRALAGQLRALIESAELAYRDCEQAWQDADRDYRAARARLGAPDPDSDLAEPGPASAPTVPLPTVPLLTTNRREVG